MGDCGSGWAQRCITCVRGMIVDERKGLCICPPGTLQEGGKCIRMSNSRDDNGKDYVVKKSCIRWHPDSACRNGSRAGLCRSGWSEKCVRCRRGMQVDKMTGGCMIRRGVGEGDGSSRGKSPEMAK
jgi:hypothetical protein